MAAQQPETEAERRKRTKKVYEAAVRCVDYNSGRNQPPLAKQTSVIQTLHGAGYGSYGLDEVHRALTAARANGDLFVAVDAEGRTRLGIDDEARLLEKVASYFSTVEKERRREDVIGLANQRVQQLRGRDSDE